MRTWTEESETAMSLLVAVRIHRGSSGNLSLGLIIVLEIVLLMAMRVMAMLLLGRIMTL